MTDNKGGYHVIRQTLDGIMGGATPQSTPDPAHSIALTVNGGTVVIGDVQQINAQPPAPLLISEAQSRWLKSLVRQIGQAERISKPGYCDAKTWMKLNSRFGVDHHRDILRRDFDDAKAFLAEWLGSFSLI